MRNNINNRIDEVFSSIEEQPLFYVESGSRLWGIASPDSDFDVRGLHIKSKNQFFSFKKQRDIIEIMDGDFDFVSYDVDKMFGLLAKSNPTVFEWIRAHIVYVNKLSEWENFQEQLLQNIDYQALYYHYKSLSKQNIILLETDKKFTYKTVFYCSRGLLSASLASQKIIPALDIQELFAQSDPETTVLQIAKESLDIKRQKTEKENIETAEKQRILSAIKGFWCVLEQKTPESSNNRDKLEKILEEYCFSLKEFYYR